MTLNFKKMGQALICACALSMSASAMADTIRIGTHGTYAPFEFIDDAGNLTGFDVELIQAVIKETGNEVEMVNMPFDGLIPALLTRQIDGIISAMTITEERAKRVSFTKPYYTSGLSVLILEENKAKYDQVDKLKGQTLCVQIGTTGAMSAEAISPGNIKTFNSQPEAFMELKKKGCEGVINDRPINLYYLSQPATSVGVSEIPEILSADNYGIAVHKSNDELLEKINTALETLKANGTYDAIYKKWFNYADTEAKAEAK